MTQRKIQYYTAVCKGIFVITAHRLGQGSGRYNAIKQKFKVEHMGKQNKAKKPSPETNKNLNISFVW